MNKLPKSLQKEGSHTYNDGRFAKKKAEARGNTEKIENYKAKIF